MYLTAGKYAEALALLEALPETRRDFEGFDRVYGWALLTNGKLHSARLVLEGYVSKHPEDQQAQDLLRQAQAGLRHGEP